ncbi:DUF1837 domain-containing protein [uncultured Sphingomonas sp.]|uniref:HamA C-terminal domain-containing protein n=1 Tax=uncultured Sphingomonas sp. TaxID=158754 RepID=UPI0035CB9272
MEKQADQPVDLKAALLALGKDWSSLAHHLRALEHDVTTPCSRLSLRMHYPTLRDAKATVHDLIRVVTLYLPHFCLPRTEVAALYARKAPMSDMEFHAATSDLDRKARDLLMRAQKATGRSGEAGELLLYLLTEWLLEAPQIVAKVSLKTNAAMPVHGSDGVHVKFLPGTGQLVVYSGEAKLHAKVGDAVRSAMSSIVDALKPEKVGHELQLVHRDVSFSGLDEAARGELLRFLNPMEPKSKSRIDAIACLIGFDFAGYADLDPQGDPDAAFRALALLQLEKTGTAFADAMAKAGLKNQLVELFLLPVPSVAELRSSFEASIGGTAT